MTDRRHIRGRIRAELRRQAAIQLAGLSADYFCSGFVIDSDDPDDVEAHVAFARREHMRLIRHLREGLAIGPLSSRRRK